MNKFLSLMAVIALSASLGFAVVVEDFEAWTGAGTPVADPEDAGNTVLALTTGEFVEITLPESIGVVTMDIYDFGEAVTGSGAGPRWCIEGTGTVGAGLLNRPAVDINVGYSMGSEASRTGTWWSPSFFGDGRFCTLETFIDPAYQDDGVGQWTTWTFETFSNGTAEIRAGDIVQNTWWNGDPMLIENMTMAWISGGSFAELQVAAGTYAGYTVLVDNIKMGEDELWPGDVDGDCDVDITDFLILKSNYGTATGATRSMGDLDADGDVDITDFLILKSNYGTSCPAE